MSILADMGNIPEFTQGDRLRVALRHAGIGVQEMADYLDVTRGSVGNWINDRVAPSKQTMRLWALRCGVSLEWLETGKAPTGNPSGPGSYTTRDSNPEPAGLAYSRLAGRRSLVALAA